MNVFFIIIIIIVNMQEYSKIETWHNLNFQNTITKFVFYFITWNKYGIARSILPKLLIIKDKTYCIQNSWNVKLKLQGKKFGKSSKHKH